MHDIAHHPIADRRAARRSPGTFALLATLTLAALLPAAALAATDPALIRAAIAAPDRPAADLERDPNSRPDAVLALADIGPGDVVADLFAGAGYYSELLAHIVGPGGRVYVHENAAYMGFVGEKIENRLADGRLPETVLLRTEIPDLQLPEHGLDLALMVLSWHDLYWVADDWPKVDIDGFLAQLARALKPDGVLVIVDHAADPGVGADEVDPKHRISRDFVVSTLQDHGWQLTGSSKVLRNPDDDHSLTVFDPEIRHHTDRFILRFAPPQA